ncbi:PD-(D/E)XK nuclease family protein [Psychroserpens sp. SPM9]|uniref:PD-(D/E)XK nuclease family protein n=1 Tax=Psychroserpens sp. SPM9 TaxID=2975598 RepID=UPI0021A723E4|nr:PD-(D/E)XK nuclease family protein [Psychroserpens sp. SPM9]MDG5490966.1 PD-(D/E)XK nuclease family protein [Psychroserpens sp. SPM9]
MRTFIDDVIIDLINKEYNISQLTFVLPSKRAGTFLKHAISKHVKSTLFAPEIVSIESFVETLSDFQYATNAELLFEFYDVYIKQTPKDQIEPFDKFSKWAQLLLQDFNEIDRYLIPQDQVFDYLSAIKEIEHQHWSLDEEPTPYIKNYLLFWNRLKFYYYEFQKQLTSKKKGYQGLVYREAVNNLEQFISVHSNTTYVFVGFNALNRAEELIIQELLQQELALIYWDIDTSFITNPVHDAGLFTRHHKTHWKYFDKHEFNWATNHYSEEKEIHCIGAPKNISQVKYVGELLETIYNKKQNLQNTAVVLGDESLLLPLLNSIPKSINAINITMGLPLRVIPLASLFETLFYIHKSASQNLYYKDVINVLSNPFINSLLNQDAEEIIKYIRTNNKTYLGLEHLKQLTPQHKDIIDLLFGSWADTPNIAIKNCSKLILKLKSDLDTDKQNNVLPLEYLYRFNQVFNSLESLNQSFTHITSISTLFSLYRELIKIETLDFKGEPLQGLQIMGMLESRVLDFETVIITSVNEGILPTGKTNSSFIPFDVKIENKLPTYKEKDAVYTYHFYHLLQRAKTAYILYNTEPDVLNGGEKSRFITQLEIEGIHNIKSYVLSSEVPSIERSLQSIKKSPEILQALDRVAEKGFSPSSLTNYIRNPIDFYYEKILGIHQYEDVEENVAFNTLGTIIHNTLEDFYEPLEGENLTTEHLKAMASQIDTVVAHHFKEEFKEGDISSGKNLIIFEIAKRYIANFLNLEIEDLKQGNTIKIIAIETKNKVAINLDNISKTVFLTGKVDRVDAYNGTLRIIDYKTGRVEPGKVQVTNWEDITTDYDKYSKSFQLLMYAYMMYKSDVISLPVEAGIISFKSLNSGVLKFAKKIPQSKSKDYTITSETLDAFEVELKSLISELYNPDIDFIEKEI